MWRREMGGKVEDVEGRGALLGWRERERRTTTGPGFLGRLGLTEGRLWI